MTPTAVATEQEFDLDRMHPIWSAKYQIETATTELKKLGEKEAALREERLVILKEHTGGYKEESHGPGLSWGTDDTAKKSVEKRLQDLESEINRLQVRQTRESDKIKALTDELPQTRKEAQEQLDKLTTLKKRLPKVTSEIESIDSRLTEVLSKELAQRLIDLIEERNQAQKELKGLPFLISNTRSFFHLQPGIEQIDVPKLPEHIRTLIEALSK